MKISKHIRAILLLPVMATIVVPGIVVYLTGPANIGWALSPPLNLIPSLLGICVIGLGLILVVRTITLLATSGGGTLAPWDPTQKLVVQGAYRYVRNPMISGVFCVLLGEAVLSGSLPLLCWFTVFVLLNLIYTPLVEERDLEHRFGEDHILYKQNVPRWLPRTKPWDAPF